MLLLRGRTSSGFVVSEYKEDRVATKTAFSHIAQKQQPYPHVRMVWQAWSAEESEKLRAESFQVSVSSTATLHKMWAYSSPSGTYHLSSRVPMELSEVMTRRSLGSASAIFHGLFLGQTVPEELSEVMARRILRFVLAASCNVAATVREVCYTFGAIN